jgi:hypothetical protein
VETNFSCRDKFTGQLNRRLEGRAIVLTALPQQGPSGIIFQPFSGPSSFSQTQVYS